MGLMVVLSVSDAALGTNATSADRAARLLRALADELVAQGSET